MREIRGRSEVSLFVSAGDGGGAGNQSSTILSYQVLGCNLQKRNKLMFREFANKSFKSKFQ